MICVEEIDDFLSFIMNCKNWRVCSRCLCFYPFNDLICLSLNLGLFGSLPNDLEVIPSSLPKIHRFLINNLVTISFKFQLWSYKSVYWLYIFIPQINHSLGQAAQSYNIYVYEYQRENTPFTFLYGTQSLGVRGLL